MARKTPPCSRYPEWSEAKFWSFVRSGLRAQHIKWPPAQNVMKQGRRKVEGKKWKFEHQCEMCKEWFPEREIEKDHITPTGSLKCLEDLAGFVDRMFVSEEGYRKLCKGCHRIVTNEERKK